MPSAFLGAQMQSIFEDLVPFKVGDLQEDVTRNARSARSGGTTSGTSSSTISKYDS